MSKKAVSVRVTKKPLKDFSELQKINQKRLDLIAMQIYLVVFKGAREKAFEPKPKTLVHKVWDMGKLSIRQQQGWAMLCKDIQEAFGKSGSVSSGYGELHDGGEPTFLPRAYVNEAYRRLDDLEKRFLSRREKALLKDLVRNTAQESHEIKFEHIGLIRSGYGGENSAHVAGVVHTQVVLDRLADFYGY